MFTLNLFCLVAIGVVLAVDGRAGLLANIAIGLGFIALLAFWFIIVLPGLVDR